MFDALRIARPELTFRQCCKKPTVRQGEGRQLKYHDLTLELVEVDSQFPTYAGVYERQQCSGNEQKVDSPLKGGRAKPPHISENATTENDQCSVAVQG